MYKLYWAPNTGAFAPHVMLEEIGADYEIVVLDKKVGEHRGAAYRALNPACKIPALMMPDGTVMAESAAIVLHLGDSHPEAGLLPSPGTPERARLMHWLMFLASGLYEADLRWNYSERYTDDAAGAGGVKDSAAMELDRLFALIEGHALDPGPYVLGETYSAVDVYLLMLAEWHYAPAQLYAGSPRIARVRDLLRARPAVQRIWAQHHPQAGEGNESMHQ